jgi:SAM-dependent methyltransferase
MTVSQQDIDHLKIIRESVRQHIKGASQYDARGCSVLDIAPQVHAGAKEFFNHASVKTLDIEPGADYCADICKDNSALIPDNSFDVIVCTEVLEHVANPFAAVAEINRILKPTGQVYVTTPFNFRIHGPLPDNWRFTEHGLRQLFSSMEITSLEGVTTDGRDLMPIHYRLIARKSAG